MDYTAIGKRVLKIRKKLNMTQAEFSEQIGISLSFLGHIERGTRVMSVQTLKRIAEVGHCSADYLLGIEAEQMAIDEYVADLLEKVLLLVQKRMNMEEER